jgi:N-methylhydantoinase A
MTFRIGIDIGGTFTDIVVLGPDGVVATSKVPSTPTFDYPHFSEGFASLAPRAMSVSRERPRHITVFPGGGSLVRAK